MAYYCKVIKQILNLLEDSSLTSNSLLDNTFMIYWPSTDNDHVQVMNKLIIRSLYIYDSKWDIDTDLCTI